MWRCLLVLAGVYFALQAVRPGRVSAGAAPGWPAEVKGYGETPREAKDWAVKYLSEDLAKFLARQTPPLTTWQPTADWVKRHLLRGEGYPGEDSHFEGVGTRKTWIYPVRAPDLGLLRSLDEEAQRLARSQQRMALAARVFAGLMLVLAAVTVYAKARGLPRPHDCRATHSPRN
jgi:hypothetical protein